jgi:hypothetical protein
MEMIPVIDIQRYILRKKREGGVCIPLGSDIFSPECTRQVADKNDIPDTPDNPERHLQSLVILDIHQLLV